MGPRMQSVNMAALMLDGEWLCGATPTWREHLIIAGGGGPELHQPNRDSHTNDYDAQRHAPA